MLKYSREPIQTQDYNSGLFDDNILLTLHAQFNVSYFAIISASLSIRIASRALMLCPSHLSVHK